MSRAKRILVIPLICCCKRKLSWVPMRGELSELQAAQLAAQLSCWLDAERHRRDAQGLGASLAMARLQGSSMRLLCSSHLNCTTTRCFPEDAPNGAKTWTQEPTLSALRSNPPGNEGKQLCKVLQETLQLQKGISGYNECCSHLRSEHKLKHGARDLRCWWICLRVQKLKRINTFPHWRPRLRHCHGLRWQALSGVLVKIKAEWKNKPHICHCSGKLAFLIGK